MKLAEHLYGAIKGRLGAQINQHRRDCYLKIGRLPLGREILRMVHLHAQVNRTAIHVTNLQDLLRLKLPGQEPRHLRAYLDAWTEIVGGMTNRPDDNMFENLLLL